MAVKLPLSFEQFVIGLIGVSVGSYLKPERRNLNLEELVDQYSPKIDSTITCMELTGVRFEVGQLKITAVTSRSFVVSYELCFRKTDSDFKRLGWSDVARSAENWLSDDARNELLTVREKVFEIEAPVY